MPTRPPQVKLEDLASFDVNMNLLSWRLPPEEYKRRRALTLRFVREDIEEEYVRFLWRSASAYATLSIALVVVGLGVMFYEVIPTTAGYLYVAISLIIFVILACISCGTLRFDANSGDHYSPNASGTLHGSHERSPVRDHGLHHSHNNTHNGNANHIRGAMDMSTGSLVGHELTYAYRYQYVSSLCLAALSVLAYVPSRMTEGMCRLDDTNMCRYQLLAAPFVLFTMGILVFRVRFFLQVAFLIATVVFAVLGTADRNDRAGHLSGQQYGVLTASYLLLFLAFVPLMAAREAGLRSRFMLLAEVFLMSDRLEHHQEAVWNLVRAVVPSVLLPRIRIASSGETARIVDLAQPGIVVATSVHNFADWSLTLLPFNVVLSLTRLFAEFDRCLANVDPAVACKATISGDKYIIVGGLTRAKTLEPARLSPSLATEGGVFAGCSGFAGDLLVALDIAEEQVRLGQNIARANPEIFGRLAVSVGIGTGELFAGVSGKGSLKYLVAGHALHEATQWLNYAGRDDVVISSDSRRALEDTFGSEVYCRPHSDGCHRVQRVQHTAQYPGLHNMVLAADLLVPLSPGVPTGHQSILDEPALGSGPYEREDPAAPMVAIEPARSSPATMSPAFTALDAPAFANMSPGQTVGLLGDDEHGRVTPGPSPPPFLLGGTQPALRSPQAALHSSTGSAPASTTLLSNSTLLATAAADHRAHIADDNALAQLLDDAGAMLARDPCTGRYLNEEVEEAVHRFAADDDRRYGMPIAASAALGCLAMVVMFIADELIGTNRDSGDVPPSTPRTITFNLTNQTTLPPVYTSPAPTPSRTSAASGLSEDQVNTVALQGALLFIAAILSGVRLLFAWRQLLVPTYVELALTAGIAGASTCAGLGYIHHNIITFSSWWMIPYFSVVAVTSSSRPYWMFAALAIVIAMGLPLVFVSYYDKVYSTPIIFVRTGLFCICYSIVAAGLSWVLRTRFGAVLLAGEFLQLAKKRLAIRDELLRGLLPSHVIQPMVDTAGVPEEMRLMADRPHFLEVWEELVVAHVRYDNISTMALSGLGSSIRSDQSRRSSGAQISPFELAAARLADVTQAITTVAGDYPSLLDVVEALGDDLVVAGCVAPLEATPSYTNVQLRARDAAAAAIAFCRVLHRLSALRHDASTSVLVCESGYGAVLGSQVLNYCVLGVARRTAGSVLRGLPDLGPPGASRRTSYAFALAPFIRLYRRTMDVVRLDESPVELELNPLHGIGPSVAIPGFVPAGRRAPRQGHPTATRGPFRSSDARERAQRRQRRAFPCKNAPRDRQFAAGTAGRASPDIMSSQAA
jgi:hypothetical protein